MNTKDILQLIKTVTETGYQHIDVSHEGSRIVLSNSEYAGLNSHTMNHQNVEIPAPSKVSVPVSPTSNERVEGTVAAGVSQEIREESVIENPGQGELVGHIVESPIVGTFYSAASPDVDDYVKVGDKVSKGDVLCIIEAMKLMNEIEADQDGEIAEILVKNEDGVEYGQPLFRIV